MRFVTSTGMHIKYSKSVLNALPKRSGTVVPFQNKVYKTTFKLKYPLIRLSGMLYIGCNPVFKASVTPVTKKILIHFNIN